jgi:hypothetical protein
MLKQIHLYINRISKALPPLLESCDFEMAAVHEELLEPIYRL